MSITTPSMAYDHLVQLVSGPMEPNTLQIGAAVADSEVFVAGALVSLDASGDLVKGCSGTKMPLWAINGTADLDVVTEGSTYGGGHGISGGNVNCYVAAGGYELFTSEYDSATGNTYAPNTLLTPATATADVGKVTEAAVDYSNALVCGVVSRGVSLDQYGKNVLYFWPTFVPALATATA